MPQDTVFEVIKLDKPICQNLQDEDVFVTKAAKKLYDSTLSTTALRGMARRAKETYLVSWAGSRNPRGAKIGGRVVAREEIGRTAITLQDVLGHTIGLCEYRPTSLGGYRMIVFVK